MCYVFVLCPVTRDVICTNNVIFLSQIIQCETTFRRMDVHYLIELFTFTK